MNDALSATSTAQSKNVTSERAIAEIIGQFAADFSYENIPEPVRASAKYVILDAIGIAFASTRFDFAQRAYCALASSDREAGSVVIGMPGCMELRDAVLMNGMLVHGLDYDDSYLAGGIHPTSSCFPAALGVALHTGASGRQLLGAYILGIEVITRLATVAHGVLNQGGIHPSSLLAPFAGAVIAGWLMQLNARQMTMAQGIALGMAGGTLESLQDGSWTKRLQPGSAAASGITAARLARQGFVGSVRAYEGKFGLFPVFLGAQAAQCDYAAATAGLGTNWQLSEIALKPYPACHATQSPIEAAINIARQSGLKAEDVESITAIVPPHYVKLTCEPIERKRRPESVYGAQFSLPYTVASAFIAKAFGLAQLHDSALNDQRILSLAQKVTYRVDENLAAEFKRNRPAELLVIAKDGRKFSNRVAKLRGSPECPMTIAEITAKFMDNATAVMSSARAAQIRDAVLALDAMADARTLGAMVSG